MLPDFVRPWLCTVLCSLFVGVQVIPCTGWGASIRVAALQTSEGYPPGKVVRTKGAVANNGESQFAFEEPEALEPDAPPQSPGSTDDGCSPPEGGAGLPRVAIIIDDMGYHRNLGESLLALEMNLTFSFLPHAPYVSEQMNRARQAGHDILLHMPMEARDPASDPGPGALFVSDPLPELSRKVAQNLASVPGAVGINNHMGSRFTSDEAAMRRFFNLLAGRNFLFVDSGTSSQSVAMETAQAMGIRTARRHIFLDNARNSEDICRQIKQLVKEARKRGWAIGIGHPNKATLDALTRCRTMLLNQVQLVGIHELAK